MRQQWVPQPDEALYGLGENQMGLLNLKGYDLDLWQHNGTLVVPFLVSSRGWGILWDNTSFTRFGDLRELAPIPADHLYDAHGKRGGLTGSYYSGANFGKLVGERVDRGETARVTRIRLNAVNAGKLKKPQDDRVA